MSHRKLKLIQIILIIPLFAISAVFLFFFFGGPWIKEDKDNSPDGIMGWKRKSFFKTARFVLVVPFIASLIFILQGLFANGGFIGSSYLALCLGIGGIIYSVVSYFVLR